MKIKKGIFSLLLLLLGVLYASTAFGQKTKTSPILTKKDRQAKGKSSNRSKGNYKDRNKHAFWIIGVGGNVVDDDGSPFKYLFNALPRWNVRPYPTRFTLEKSLKGSFSFEGAFNFNTYKGFKIINNEVGKAGIFLSLDGNFKNDINKMINKEGWFNPYFVYGLGATFRTVRSLPVGGNINAGVGFNFWLTKSFGFNVQSIAKFGISPTRFLKTSQNYLQHSLSVVIKLQKGGKNPFIRPRYKWVHRKNLSQERN